MVRMPTVLCGHCFVGQASHHSGVCHKCRAKRIAASALPIMKPEPEIQKGVLVTLACPLANVISVTFTIALAIVYGMGYAFFQIPGFIGGIIKFIIIAIIALLFGLI